MGHSYITGVIHAEAKTIRDGISSIDFLRNVMLRGKLLTIRARLGVSANAEERLSIVIGEREFTLVKWIP
jgi:hypothetical protein